MLRHDCTIVIFQIMYYGLINAKCYSIDHGLKIILIWLISSQCIHLNINFSFWLPRIWCRNMMMARWCFLAALINWCPTVQYVGTVSIQNFLPTWMAMQAGTSQQCWKPMDWESCSVAIRVCYFLNSALHFWNADELNIQNLFFNIKHI